MKKQQTIETLQSTLEWVMQEWINTKQELAEVRIELEETQEALRRNRNQLESYKCYEKELVITRIERNMNEWFLKSAESAIRYYENMSIWTFIKNKFVKR